MKMRKYVIGFTVLGCAVVATFVFLIAKAAGPKIVYPVEAVGVRTIEEKVLASGSIVPEKEVEVKSSLSGVVGELFVDPGDPVRRGDPLLSVRVVASSLDLNSAETGFEKASIRLKSAEAEMKMNRALFERKMIAQAEFDASDSAYRLALEDYKEAKNRIMLIREGGSADKRGINNLVFSPIDGTVLDIPVKQGSPVQESGVYAVGTTVALIADMGSLIFEGEIDEGQIDRIRKGMEAKIKPAAIDDTIIPGTVSFLSPQGKESSGSIKFKIKIALRPPRNVFLRAGYSASAEIILKRAENVVCAKERDILLENGRNLVELEKAPQEFVKKEVTLGVSDGLFTEIKSGLSKGDRIKSLAADTAR